MDTETVSVVLVTNVGQGFGRAIALAYGEADFDVVCADRDVDLASKTAAEIEEAGGQAIPIQASMTTAAEVRKAFDKVYEIFGNLSGVVHVLNFESRTSFIHLTEGELAELLEETLRSTFLTLKTAARYLKGAWLVLVAPPLNLKQPQMAAIQGALTALVERYRDTIDITINVVVPSRTASDPLHDAPLVENVMYLGSSHHGVNGQRIIIKLPPPPRVIEALLPEVRAALDESLGQEELEASLYADLPEVLAAASATSSMRISSRAGAANGVNAGHDDADDDTDDDTHAFEEDDSDSDDRNDGADSNGADSEDEDEFTRDASDAVLDDLATRGLPEPADAFEDQNDVSEDDNQGDSDYDYYSDYGETYADDANQDDGYPTESYTQFEPDGEDAADVYRRSRRVPRKNDD